MYGATSVRVDTSDDGSTWTEGATYYEDDGMLTGDGDLSDPSSLPDVMDACFTLESSVETQHIRLSLQQAVDDTYLGIAEVRFVETCVPKCNPASWEDIKEQDDIDLICDGNNDLTSPQRATGRRRASRPGGSRLR